MSVMMMVSVEVDGSGPAGRFGGKGRPGGLSLSFIYKLEENSNLEVQRKFNFFGILCLSMSYVLP